MELIVTLARNPHKLVSASSSTNKLVHCSEPVVELKVKITWLSTSAKKIMAHVNVRMYADNTLVSYILQ